MMKQRPACPNGHAAVTGSDNFCWSCGEKVIMRDDAVCACGYEFGGAERYCPKCGQKPFRIGMTP
jgi:hypothetical protein